MVKTIIKILLVARIIINIMACISFLAIDFWLLSRMWVTGFVAGGGLREAFLNTPLLISVVPLASIFGIILGISIFLNLKEKRKGALGNLVKFLGIYILAKVAVLAELSQITKIGVEANGSYLSYGQSLSQHLAFGFWDFIFFILPLAGFVWIYVKERDLCLGMSIWGKSLGDTILKWLLIASIGIVLLVNILAYIKAKELNPGLGQIQQQVGYNVYGFSKSDPNYRWTLISALLDDGSFRGSVEVPGYKYTAIVSVHQNRQGTFDESLAAKLKDGRLESKNYTIKGQNVVGGQKITENENVFGMFIWSADEKTDVVFMGFLPENLSWETVLSDLISNFEPIK